MRILKVLLFTVVFLLFGELLVRIDEALAPFAADDQFRVAIKMQESAELELLQTHRLVTDDSTYRVMILGDSYIHGAAIQPGKRFADYLRSKLLSGVAGSRYKRTMVLDVSRPANNSLDNYHAYKEFCHEFKPQLTILAYNHNDINDDLDEGSGPVHATGELPAQQKAKPSFTKRIYNVIYSSHLIHFCLRNLNLFLKSWGYVVPHSVFDETLKAYTQNKPNWQKSKAILTKLTNESAENHDTLLVILMPEYDLIGSKQLFAPSDTAIGRYFGQTTAHFENPIKYYVKFNPKDLRLSKYDGHPNELAHRILADSMIAYIRSKYLHSPEQPDAR